MSVIEVLNKEQGRRSDIKVVILDFDGTISTLRQGWEEIMEPFMLEMISGQIQVTTELINEVRNYITESTGIQTVFQMEWLAKKVKEYDLNLEVLDRWGYKAEYNRRLLAMVNQRLKSLETGERDPRDFLIKGSHKFLKELKSKGFELIVASGTDHPDLLHEAEVLGVKKYFNMIMGAPVDRADDSKEAVIRSLLEDRQLNASQILIIGDGKVEISLGKEKGAITLGMATNETKREGIDSCKRKRLLKAGADAITGDFKNIDQLWDWLGIK